MRSPALSSLRNAVLATAIGFACSLSAHDWPHWRGPSFNGISAEKDLADTWPAEGLKPRWKAAVGVGFSSMSVAANRVYTLGHADDHDTLWCFDATTGAVLWKHRYESDLGDKYFEGGPTSTPTIHGDRVLALSRWGDVFCLDAATGKLHWTRNIQKLTSAKIPDWGYSGSPVVVGDTVVFNVGDGGSALKLSDGSLAWKTSTQDAGYSTPLPFKQGNDALLLLASAKAYVAVHAATGKEAWRFPWPTQYGVNAADPVIQGDKILISSGYGKGAALITTAEGTPKVVWENKNLRTQMNPSVLLGGFLYGIDGDTSGKATLKCVELETGKVRWTEAGIGSGSVIAAGDRLLVLTDRGELLLAPASPEGFKPTARTQVLGGKCWTSPVLSEGRIYCRNAAGALVCLDLPKR